MARLLAWQAALFFALVPMAAIAQQVARAMEPGTFRFWATLAAVQVLWAVGYLASSLPGWAKWQDGVLLERLQIVQGMLVAGLGGNIAYFGGYYGLEMAEITCFISTGIAGYGGDRFVSPLLGRLTAAMDTLFGRTQGNGGPKP